MGKTKLYTVSEAAANISRTEMISANSSMMSGLLTSSFPEGTVICLLPGGQFLSNYMSHDYMVHKVLVFKPGQLEGLVDLLTKSKHIYSHLGQFTLDNRDMPSLTARISNKGLTTPDADWIDAHSPFTFKLISHSTGNDVRYNVMVEKPQWVKVKKTGYFWVPKYDSKGNAILTKDEEHCDLKKVAKPIFEAYTPDDTQKETLKQVLKDMGL